MVNNPGSPRVEGELGAPRGAAEQPARLTPTSGPGTHTSCLAGPLELCLALPGLHIQPSLLSLLYHILRLPFLPHQPSHILTNVMLLLT